MFLEDATKIGSFRCCDFRRIQRTSYLNSDSKERRFIDYIYFFTSEVSAAVSMISFFVC